MKKVLNYNGMDYYLFNEFLSEHHEYQHIDERKAFIGTVMSFHNERFITEQTWKRMEYAIHLNEDMISEAASVIHIVNTGYNISNEIIDLLDQMFEFEVNEDIHYYKKSDIEPIHSLSELLSKYSEDTLIAATDLIKHHNKNRLLHSDLLIMSEYHIPFLYKRSRLSDINGFLCVQKSGKNPYDEFEEIINEKNPMLFFENYFEGCRKFYSTLRFIKEYFRTSINNSNTSNRDAQAKAYITILYRFYSQLDKELTAYSTTELRNFLEENSYFTKNKYIIQFIEYVRQENKEFLPELKQFRVKADNVRSNYNGILYSPEEFSAIYDAAIDISRHVDKAYNDYAYAQYWLSVLLLLTNFIRQSDIFNTPIFEYPYSFEWEYFIKNSIQLHEAQAICNHFEINVKNIRIGKTGEKKSIHFLQDQIEAVAVALIICNDFAKRKNLPKLFSMRSISSDRVYAKLGEPFYDIGNRKLNYTLATYFEETGNEASEYRNKVYKLLGYMRGHRMKNPLSPSETTLTYIKADNTDSDVSLIAYHTVSRGVFGWLYHVMLDYAGEIFDTMDAESERIINLQEKYNPDNIEKLSEYLAHEKIARLNVLKNLTSFQKGDVKMFLKNIGNSMALKGIKEFPCILGRNCPKGCDDCAYCEFSIKTVHSLIVYKSELERIISVLSSTNNIAEVKKNMYLLFKIMIVVKDFKNEFDKFDKDYINAFINTKEIMTKMDLLPPSYTKILGDVINGEST